MNLLYMHFYVFFVMILLTPIPTRTDTLFPHTTLVRTQFWQWLEKFAAVYTPAVIAVALAIFLVPSLAFGAAWAEWFYRALVLLVIACPCALVISTRSEEHTSELQSLMRISYAVFCFKKK